jgi:hypothetical protein
MTANARGDEVEVERVQEAMERRPHAGQDHRR